MKSNCTIYLCLVVALLVAQNVWAGGFTIPIIGGKMVGRLAFVAKADDTTAMYHNPAGLCNTSWLRFDISGTSIYSHTVYRKEFSDGTFSGPIKFDRAWGTLPFIGVSGGFGKWRFGFAAYSPRNAASSLPSLEGRDREIYYQLKEGKIISINYNPTVAYQVTDWMAVGLGVSAVQAFAEIKRLDRLGVLDVDIDLKVDDWSWGYDIGFMFKPLEKLSIGLVYIGKTELSATGDIDFDLLATGDEGAGNATIDLELPQVIKVGFNYTITPKIDIGLDFYWEDYSVYDELPVEIKNVTINGQPAPFGNMDSVEPKNCDDIIGIGLGGTYQVLEPLGINFGYFYDQSPYPDNTYSILSPDADKHGLAIGVSYVTPIKLEIHVSYLRLFYDDRIIHNSILDPKADGHVKDKFTTIFGFQLGYAF